MPPIARSVLLFVKLVALTLLLLITSALGARLLPPAAGGDDVPSAPSLLLILGLFFLQTVALAYPIRVSRWHGWRLAGAIALLFFGTVTFLSQIESLVYLGDKMPDRMLAGLFAMGLINAVVLAPAAVALLGRWSRPAPAATSPPTAPPPHRGWRVAFAGLVYLALYYLFGYYVAWQSPAVREYYGGTDPGSFTAQIASVVEATPWMLPFQYLRGLAWAALALLVIRLVRGGRARAGMAMALLFTVPALYLVLPNPMMPAAVRWTHLVETAPYQLFFACFAAWWLGERTTRAAAV